MNKRHKQRRTQAEQRYHQHRQRNLLAQPGAHQFVIVLDHLKPGFNIAKIFRSAQAFGATAVHLINIPPFDPAPAKGAFKHVPARFYDSFADCHAELSQQDYAFFSLEPHDGDLLHSIGLPQKSAFILGHEEFGISFDANQYKDIQPLRIPQFGKVESLNVSIAASIVMYEYVRQHTL